MTRLEAQRLTVERGGRAVVEAVDLTLEGGQFVALIGPNGAGKSTILATLAGLLTPDHGEVLLHGVPLPRIERRALARQRAYLPQNPRAEWPVSVERLVALGLTPQLPAFGGLPGHLQVRVAEVLAQVDLTDRREQPATTLSGGELARAMLARALVGDPGMLLADEPLAGLDPRHAIDGVTRLRALADEGKLVVAALHDLSLVARYATHVAVMHKGRLAAFGPTATALTADVLRRVFEVDARVSDSGTPAATIDFAPQASGGIE